MATFKTAIVAPLLDLSLSAASGCSRGSGSVRASSQCGVLDSSVLQCTWTTSAGEFDSPMMLPMETPAWPWAAEAQQTAGRAVNTAHYTTVIYSDTCCAVCVCASARGRRPGGRLGSGAAAGSGQLLGQVTQLINLTCFFVHNQSSALEIRRIKTTIPVRTDTHDI